MCLFLSLKHLKKLSFGKMLPWVVHNPFKQKYWPGGRGYRGEALQ